MIGNLTSTVFPSQGRRYSISQQPLTSAQTHGLLAFTFDLAIPPQAEIRDVMLNDTTEAEIVDGFWVESSDDETTYVWRDFWYFSLRWQDDAHIYEITIMPTGGTSTRDQLVQELIDLANDLIA